MVAEDEEEDAVAQKAGDDSAMDIDLPEPFAATVGGPAQDANVADESNHELEDDEDSDDEDRENPADVAMVPMADMLNARFESENVRPLGALAPGPH